GWNSRPRRPAGFGARVYTAAMSCPASATAVSVGTAKSGVPMKIRRRGMERSRVALGSTSLSAMVGQSEREGRNKLRLLLLLALAGLGKFLGNPLALEAGDMVDEQHAVEVVDLVLQAGGEQSVGFHHLFLAIKIEVGDAHGGGPRHLLVEFRDREAAFLV